MDAPFWQSKHRFVDAQGVERETTIHHFVFGREGTPAGDAYNDKSVKLLSYVTRILVCFVYDYAGTTLPRHWFTTNSIL